MMNKKEIYNFSREIFIGVLFTGIAVLIRVLFFLDLERGIPYLTFYPTVSLVALYGSLTSGLTVTMLSFFLTFLWILKGNLTGAEWLAEAVFIVSCIIISFVGGSKNKLENEEKKIKNELEKKTDELVDQNKKLLDEITAHRLTEMNLGLSEKELLQKNKELEEMNKLMVGRELKMAEMKKQLAALEEKLNSKQ